MTDNSHAVGRGARDAIEEEDGAVFMTDQDDDDEHVKLLNPVKVQAKTHFLLCVTLQVISYLGCMCDELWLLVI